MRKEEFSMRNRYPEIDVYQTGQNIKRIMHMRGMKVRDIQEYLGLAAPQSVYHWFDGKSLPTVDNLYMLSELLRVPMDMLIRGSGKHDFALCAHPECRRILKYYRKCENLKAG